MVPSPGSSVNSLGISPHHTAGLPHGDGHRCPGSPFASACGIVWNFRTLFDPDRLSPVVTSFLPIPLATQGPFPRSGLPDFIGTTDLSATLATRTDPRGVPVAVCAASPGLPVFHHPSSSTRASANTPAETVGFSLGAVSDTLSTPSAAFLHSTESRLPHYPFSRPAQHSLTFWPVWSLNRSMRPFYTAVLQPMSLPP